jgi:hypothetical protein
MTGLSASRNGGTCPSQITSTTSRVASRSWRDSMNFCGGLSVKVSECQFALAAVTRSWIIDLVERCGQTFARNILTVKGTFSCSYLLARHRSVP